ncbi:MAG: TatD family hydrolase [Bilophila sp.]
MSKKKDGPRPLPETLGLPCTGADSHAHLDSKGLIEDLSGVLERAQRAGVAHIGQVFLGPAAYHAFKDALAAYPWVFFLLGIHPCDAAECTPAVVDAMRTAFLEDTRLRAVGEIGLDLYWKDCPFAVQEAAFRVQLALARETKRPVVIHSRDAAAETLRILESEHFAGHPLLWHCFSGDAVAHLDRILANGWYVSIPGPVTYPSSQELRDVLVRIPADRLLVETDCPYLTPLPWRGKTNEPALVAFTAAAVAAARNEDLATLWTRCGENTLRFFAAP